MERIKYNTRGPANSSKLSNIQIREETLESSDANENFLKNMQTSIKTEIYFDFLNFKEQKFSQRKVFFEKRLQD